MQEQLVEMHLFGADPQLHLHPLAAQGEDHWLRVLLNAADKVVFQESS